MAKNPLNAIKKTLNKTAGAVTKTTNELKNLDNIVKDIQNIIKQIVDFLKCPISIVTNFPKCSWFYIVDLNVWLFHLVPFFISFVTIYIPLQIILWIIVIINRGQLKINFFKKVLTKNKLLRKYFFLDLDTFTVTKHKFAEVIENIFYYLSGGRRLISRSSSDVSKCYCMLPVKWLFNPLMNFEPFGKKISDSFSFLNMPIMAFIIVFMIFIPYFLNK